MLQNLFVLRQFRLTKCSFFVYNTTPYIHPRLDSRIGPRFPDLILTCPYGEFVVTFVCQCIIITRACRTLLLINQGRKHI